MIRNISNLYRWGQMIKDICYMNKKNRHPKLDFTLTFNNSIDEKEMLLLMGMFGRYEVVESLVTYIVYTTQIDYYKITIAIDFDQVDEVALSWIGPEDREVSYLSFIKSVELSGVESAHLAVLLNDAVFIDLESETPPEPEYVIDWSDEVTPLTEPIIVGNPIIHNVSALPDGFRKGTITETNSEAVFEFWYYVEDGEVTWVQESYEANITVDLSHNLYPNYEAELEVEISVTNDGDTGETSFSNSMVSILGEDFPVASFPDNSYTCSQTESITSDFVTDQEAIRTRYETPSAGVILNSGVLRTRSRRIIEI